MILSIPQNSRGGDPPSEAILMSYYISCFGCVRPKCSGWDVVNAERMENCQNINPDWDKEFLENSPTSFYFWETGPFKASQLLHAFQLQCLQKASLSFFSSGIIPIYDFYSHFSALSRSVHHLSFYVFFNSPSSESKYFSYFRDHTHFWL